MLHILCASPDVGNTEVRVSCWNPGMDEVACELLHDPMIVVEACNLPVSGGVHQRQGHLPTVSKIGNPD